MMMRDININELSKHYLSIRESKNDAIITSDKSKTILSWNIGAQNLFGYSENEVIGKSISIIIPERYKLAHEKGMDSLIAGGKPRVIGAAVELSGLHKKGHEFPIELTLGLWSDGEEMYFSGIIRDISVRKKNELIIKDQAEELEKEKFALEIENQRFITISQSEKDAIITSDNEKLIHSWNKGAEMIFGYARENVIGLPISIIIPEKYRKLHDAGMDRMINGGSPQVIGKTLELSGLHKDGHEFPIELTLGTWNYQNKIFFSGIIRDITGRKKAEIAIQREKNKSDELLKNILPEETIKELKENGYVQSKYFPEASIMFTDIVGFTGIAENKKAKELVSGLNMMFTHFDKIVRRRGLEKIKTIGDSYMCAGGVPGSSHTHAVDCVLAAIQFLTYIRSEKNLLNCKIRIGIHTGSVMGGVVGDWKYTYDIWGDSVNIASRMESSGLPDKINISESTYQIVKEFFQCDFRGKIKAKNKGMMSMYRVRKIHKELSIDDQGRSPNEAFFEKYNKLALESIHRHPSFTTIHSEKALT